VLILSLVLLFFFLGVHGIQQGWDWDTTGRIASLLGSLKIGSRGGQNHKPTCDELAARFKQYFGYAIDL